MRVCMTHMDAHESLDMWCGGMSCVEEILDLEGKAMSFGTGKNGSRGLGR